MANEGASEHCKYGLEPDPIWEGYGLDSFSDFKEMVGQIRFYPQIDDEVVGRFETVKNTLIHSYFEYDLIEAAYDRALLTFEMALKRRYRGLHPEAESLNRKAPNEPYNLAGLIDWAEEKHLLEPIRQTPSKRDGREKEHVAHTLRKLRNKSVAHPDRNNRMGPMGLNMIWRIANAINHLYGDRELRRKRHLRLRNAQTTLDKVFDGQGVLDAPSEVTLDEESDQQRMLVFEAAALDCQKIENRYIVHFRFQPIFDPNQGPEDGFSMPSPILVNAVSWTRSGDTLRFTDVDGDTWTISAPEKEENKHAFQKWRSELGDSDYRVARSSVGTTLGRIQEKLQSTFDTEQAKI